MRQILIGLVLGALLIGGLFFAASHRARHPGAVGPNVNPAAIQAAAAQIKAGFVGLKRVGAWEVACAASPVIVGGKKAPKPKAQSAEKPTGLPLKLGGHNAASRAPDPLASSPAPAASTPAASPQTDAPTATPPKPAASSAKKQLSLGRCRATQAFRRKTASKKAKIVLAINLRLVGPAPGRLGVFVRLPAGKGHKGQDLVLRVGKGALKLPIDGCRKAGCVAAAILAPTAERDILSVTRADLVMPPDPAGKRAAVRLAFVGLGSALKAIRRAQF